MHIADIAVADTESAAGLRHARHPRAAWAAGIAASAIALFICYLRVAGTTPVLSDGAGQVLQAWDMLHGNPLLRGWWMTDVSFYTTELPEYAAVAAVRGLRPEVVHIAAALTYTMIVIGAALVAKGRAPGREGLVRAVLAAGIILAPELGDPTWLVLLSPDHTGTVVPILVLLLLLDWAKPHWWVPVAAGGLLAWSIIGDPLVEVIGVIPLVLACAIRACRAVLAGRQPLAARWYELSLAAAAIVAVPVAAAALHLIRSAGGFRVNAGVRAFAGVPAMPKNLWNTFEGFLSLFGADFFGEKFGAHSVAALIHLVGVALVAAALWLAIRGYFRLADLVTEFLVLAIVVNIAAYFLIFTQVNIFGTHEMAPVMGLGAALAGRLLAAPILRARLGSLVAAGLACYVLMLGFDVAKPSVAPSDVSLTAWLSQHHLDSGIGGYWESASVTLDSGNTIMMSPVRASGHGGRLALRHWEADARLFSPARRFADFLVAAPTGVSERDAIVTFGPPAYTYRYQQYVIMIWDKNLLSSLRQG